MVEVMVGEEYGESRSHGNGAIAIPVLFFNNRVNVWYMNGRARLRIYHLWCLVGGGKTIMYRYGKQFNLFRTGWCFNPLRTA